MNELNGYDIEDLNAGMSATFSKTITEADIVLFASASGDNNAMHINEEFAQTTQFKGRNSVQWSGFHHDNQNTGNFAFPLPRQPGPDGRTAGCG